MCIINFSFLKHPNYKLIIAANRDEFFERPTKNAHFWEDEPSILAGRDLSQMGTWLGVSKNGRFAALTNYRDPRLPEVRRYSRGEIVRNFLTSTDEANTFASNVKNVKDDYAGFNILLWDGAQFVHYNNIYDEMTNVSPGTHSLSNHTLNTPWPKVEKGKSYLHKAINGSDEIDREELFQFLLDKEQAPDELLPNTGVGLEMERSLSSLFINLPHYGTRASTVVLIDQQNNVQFIERTYNSGNLKFESKYEFEIEV